MKLSELVDSGMEALDGLEKRMMAEPSADLAEKLGAATLAAHASRIEQRIARLDQQRAATIERIDTALKSEHAALSMIRDMAQDMPALRPRKDGEPGKVAAKKPARPKPAKQA